MVTTGTVFGRIVLLVLVVLYLVAVIVQLVGAISVWSVPLHTLCEAYSGSAEIKTEELMHDLSSFSISSSSASSFCLHAPSNSTAFWHFPCSSGPRGFSGVNRTSSNACTLDREDTTRFMMYVSCPERLDGARQWLKAQRLRGALSEPLSDSQIEALVNSLETDCYVQKGPLLYMLVIGPIWSVLSLIVFVIASARGSVMGHRFAMSSLATSLAIIFVGLFAISIMGAFQLIQQFANCGSDTAMGPAGLGQSWFGQPCFNVNSNGESTVNPFVAAFGFAHGYYVGGGVLHVIVITILMVLSSRQINLPVALGFRLATDTYGEAKRAGHEELYGSAEVDDVHPNVRDLQMR